MAKIFRINGQNFYLHKITISLVNETDTERCLFFLFGSIPSLLKVQRIAKIFVFYRCCDSLHLVPFFESQEAAASLPPSVCKDAEDRRATTSFPLHFRIFSEKQSCCSIFPLRCAKVQRIAKRPLRFLCDLPKFFLKTQILREQKLQKFAKRSLRYFCNCSTF